jgi:predicted extracellular nuclease
MSKAKEETLRIGTFNAYNLMSPGAKVMGRKALSEKVFKNKASWMGDQLMKMNADIVGFQEIFDEAALRRVLEYAGPKYENAEIIFKPNLLHGPGGDAFASCALVTTLAVETEDIYTDFHDNEIIRYGGDKLPITSFTHPVVRARINFPTGAFADVFVVHLKSKRPIYYSEESDKNPRHVAHATARSLIRRASEAVALRMLLIKRLHKTNIPVVVLGDMNADVTSTTSEIIAGQHPWHYMPHYRVRELRDVLLYSVKDIQAKEVYHDMYYTHIHQGYYQALDHIYVSEEFVQENDKHIGSVHNVWVYNDHLVDHARLGDTVESWQSDHGQVVAEIILGRRPKKRSRDNDI